MSMPILRLCFLPLLFTAHFASSQNLQPDTLPAIELSEVTVTAFRLPENPFLAPAAFAEADTMILKYSSQGLALNEALSSLPGVFVQNSENFAQDLRLSIRGFGARSPFGIRGVKILVDGIPESTPDGQSQVDNLDPGALESIELIRSASGALYGNASGGVLNINTLNLEPGKELQAGVSAGSFGFRKYSLSLRNGSANKYAVHLRASHTALDGFREHSRLLQWNFNAGLKYQFSRSLSASLLANYVNSPLAEDPGSITAVQSMEDPTSAYVKNIEYDAGETVEQGKIALLVKKRTPSDNQFEFRSYLTLRAFENRLPFQNGGAVNLDRTFYGGSLSYQVSKKLWGRPLTGLSGVEFNLQEDKRQRFNNLKGIRGERTLHQLERFTETGFFSIWRFIAVDPLPVRVSLRYSSVGMKASDHFLADGDDSGERHYNRIVPAVNLTWQIHQQRAVFIGLTSSFETPTLNELSNNPLQNGGFNPELQPQKANTFETGIRLQDQHKKLSAEVVLFHIDLKNEIVPFELEQFPGRTFYRNSGKSKRNGLELSCSSQLSKSILWKLNYTWSDFQYREFLSAGMDYTGKRQPGVPKHLLWSSLQYRNQDGCFALIQCQYIGKFYADDGNSTEIEDALVVDGRAGYNFRLRNHSLLLNMGVNNIFNREYFSNVRINSFGGRYFEPAPGRNWFLSIKFLY